MARTRARGLNERRGKRVLISIRVSDTEGREETLISDEVQLLACRRAAEREGLTIITAQSLGLDDGIAVVELDKTGRESSKRKIGKMIQCVAENKIDGILLWKISRWGRNTVDSLLNIAELQSVGGYVVSATENLDDIETPAGRFSLTVLLAVAQMQSDEIGKTWENIHDYRLSKGKTITKGARLGYLRRQDTDDPALLALFEDGVDYIPDPVTAPWVAKAFEWYVSGRSLRAIAEDLNQAGVRSARFGNAITYFNLRKALDGGFQAGLLVDRRTGKEQFHQGGHDGIITEELFWAYRKRLAEKTPPRVKNAPHKTSRLVYCSTCDLRMYAKHSARDQIFYWYCGRGGGSSSPNSWCDDPASASNSLIEKVVLKWIHDCAEGQEALDTRLARERKATTAEKDVARIEKDLDRQRKRLKLLVDKVLDGLIDDAAYRVSEASIKANIARLEEQRSSATTDAKVNALPAATVFGAIAAGWDVLEPSIINQGLSKVIRRIVVTRPVRRYGTPQIRIVGLWED